MHGVPKGCAAQELAQGEGAASVRLVYCAHPVGSGPDREANLERFKRWFRWAIDEYPDDSLVATWAVYVQNLRETPDNRTRGIRDDLAVLGRCDAILLCGGYLSPGMDVELTLARKLGLEVVNRLCLGNEPPEFE